MSIGSKCKKISKYILKSLRYEVKNPVYVPIIKGDFLKDRIIFITGGTGGIGYSFARTFIDNGATVIITGRSISRLEKVKEKLVAETGCRPECILPIVLDMNEVNRFSNIIQQVDNILDNKKIDTLINNAGVALGAPLGETSLEDYSKTLDTNLRGTYFLSQAFSEYFINHKVNGNILNVSSASGIRPAITPYMISKWGITGMTEGMAKKLIKHDIVVNGIAPGPTATDMLNLNGENLDYEKSPARRYADPIEIANLAMFLISSAGRMIIGDTVYITGGCGNLTVDDITY